MRPILLGLVDRYATPENLQKAVAEDADIGALLWENWDDIVPIDYSVLNFMLSRVSAENIAKVNKYRVMAWIEKERPEMVRLIDSTPGAFDWLGRSVDRIMAVLPLKNRPRRQY
jgi:hypothetical protein